MGKKAVGSKIRHFDALFLDKMPSCICHKSTRHPRIRSPKPIAVIVMKSKLRCVLWLAAVLLAIESILWCRSNIATIRSSSELEALREIAHGYGMSGSSDLEAVLLRSDPGPNRGTTKTYRVSTGSGDEVSIAISSFLWLGWQEHRFERTLAVR